MGLEALGRFAEKLYSDVDAQNVNVEVLAMNEAHTFDTVSKSNSAVVQVYEVCNTLFHFLCHCVCETIPPLIELLRKILQKRPAVCMAVLH